MNPTLRQNGPWLLLAAAAVGLALAAAFEPATTGAENHGLNEPQPLDQLPKSVTPPHRAVRQRRVERPAVLEPAGPGEYRLREGWDLSDDPTVTADGRTLFDPALDVSGWLNATVPGTVLTTLVDRGVYPDPYHGLNNLAIPDDLCRRDWWYRIRFALPDEAKGREVWLEFDGVNYRADVWLNGRQLGTVSGAFRRGAFRVSEDLRGGNDNVLAVRIQPPPNPGIPHEASAAAGDGPNGGQLCLDGPTFISSEGWDWVPGIRDRNIGLWQDVRLRLTGPVTLRNPQVVTDLPLPDTSHADVSVSAELRNHSDAPRTLLVAGTIGEITFRKPARLAPGEARRVAFTPAEFPQLRLTDPRLWWPNGYGDPELYSLDLAVTVDGGRESDRRSVRFGVRELSYEMTVDTPSREGQRVELNPLTALAGGMPLLDNLGRRELGGGVAVPRLREGADPSRLTILPDSPTAPYLVVKVNGRRIFIKGGNWGMDDAMKRVSRERLEPYVRLHRDAHYNMIRNWTGESTEEAFYDLCDEYGLLVWNDFWLSTEGWNLEPNDDALFLDNARDVILRFRNHPSIAVWCPRNEGYAPPVLEEGLASLVARLDGTRHYHGNSRNLNLRPSGPWHYLKSPTNYFTRLASGFNTEMGTFSIPTAETMRTFLAPADRWPINDVWHYHDLHAKQGLENLLADIERRYGTPTGLDDLCRKAQMTNYDRHRTMFEAWNSRMWDDTSGLLLWMTHPAWPSMIWQTYTYDYETHGSYFGARKACEPIHVQLNLPDDEVVVVNASLEDIEDARVELRVLDLRGREVFRVDGRIAAPANRLTRCFTPELPAGLPEVFLVRLSLTDAEGRVRSANDYWRSVAEADSFQAFNALPQVELRGRRLSGEPARLVVAVENPSTTPALAVRLHLREPGSGARVLPAHASDGYFNLMPGEQKEVTIDLPSTEPAAAHVSASGYNVKEGLIAY